MTTPPIKISDEAIEAYRVACKAVTVPAGILSNEKIRAGLEAVAPLIAAQVLRDHGFAGRPASPAWRNGPCAACQRQVRVWEGAEHGQQRRIILDPEPSDEGDVVILDGRPVGVVREDVIGRYTLYRSHFYSCPERLVEPENGRERSPDPCPLCGGHGMNHAKCARCGKQADPPRPCPHCGRTSHGFACAPGVSGGTQT